MPKLSIIVPVYNVEKYLERCIESLIQQTYEDYEIILVNDGSTDNSQNIINQYQKKYNNLIRSFTKENGGLGDARNFGVNHCDGEFITFVDSDDYVDYDLYRVSMESIEKNNFDIVVFGMIRESNSKKVYKDIKKYFDSDEILIKNTPNACNKIIRKKIWIENNLMFPKKIWYEDVAIIPALAQYTDRIGIVEKYYYHYVIRDDSITSTKTYNKKCLEIIDSLDYLKKHLKSMTPLFEYIFITHGLYLGTQRMALHNEKEDFYKLYEHINQLCSNWKNNTEINDLPFLKKLYLKMLPNYFICRLLVLLREKVGI